MSGAKSLPEEESFTEYLFKGNFSCNKMLQFVKNAVLFFHVQLETLRKCHSHTADTDPSFDDDFSGFIVENFRPTQPLHERIIKSSFPANDGQSER